MLQVHTLYNLDTVKTDNMDDGGWHLVESQARTGHCSVRANRELPTLCANQVVEPRAKGG